MGTYLAQAGDREGGRKSRLSGAAQQPTEPSSEELTTEDTDTI